MLNTIDDSLLKDIQAENGDDKMNTKMKVRGLVKGLYDDRDV